MMKTLIETSLFNLFASYMSGSEPAAGELPAAYDHFVTCLAELSQDEDLTGQLRRLNYTKIELAFMQQTSNGMPEEHRHVLYDVFIGKTLALLDAEREMVKEMLRYGGVPAGFKTETVRRNGKKPAITLTWNGENELGSGHTTDHGLSEFGKEAVREMEKEGVLVDVSHLNDHGFADLLEVAAKPFVATHSNARALCSHKRNLTDDMIREMVRRDCLIGLNYFVKFLRDDGEVHSLDDIYRHTMHFFELGAKKNLALGSDFDGSLLPECLNTPAKAASIYEYLISRGVSQEDADGVMYKNAQEFFRKNLR